MVAEYLWRTADTQLDELMQFQPAIAIDGPKGVGKTETARRRAMKVWRLDDEAERNSLLADPQFEDAPEGTLLIDEWQHYQPVWDSVRRRVDEGAPPGRFLLTGSATPHSGRGTHSGAGRIDSVRMRPTALYERGDIDEVSLGALLEGRAGKITGTSSMTAGDYYRAIAQSGFPDLQRFSERQASRAVGTYIQRIIDQDLPEHGFSVRRPETLRRWMAAYAAASSTTATYSTILDATTSGDGHQPAKSTTIAYRDHLTQLWLLDPVPAWAPVLNSPFKWLQFSEKHQLADPGLAANLLGLSASSLGDSRGASMAGPLFESLATLSVRVAAGAAWAKVGHLRTKGGRQEVDLIVESFDGAVLGIEVKLSAHVDDKHLKHLKWLREQMPERVVDLMVLYSGKEAYRRPDGIAVVPLGLLGE